jgi:hypothetical protein
MLITSALFEADFPTKRPNFVGGAERSSFVQVN